MDNLKERFKDHVLTQVVDTPKVKVFDFRSEDGSVYLYQRWIIDRGTLIVQGDCYDSIYKWNESSITLKFLASCNLGYFSEKCRADKDGQFQKVFESEDAELYLKTIASERILQENEEFDDVDWEKLDAEQRFELVVPVIRRELDIEEYEVENLFRCDNPYDGYAILNKREHEFMFGSDGWEYGRGLEQLSMTPKMHLAALRVAYEKYPTAF